MLTNTQRDALIDEVLVTKGMWPQMPDNEHAIRGYAEHLEPFTPDEIHAGFRVARLRAEHTYPKVNAIVDGCNSAVKTRRSFREREEGDERVTPCCDGHIVWLTWPMAPCRFSLPHPTCGNGLTVDRFGIWHRLDCIRLVTRRPQQEDAA